MTYLDAFILSFIEGLTEFLPVSSTGHLILTEKALQMHPSDFNQAFQIIIQFGAIMSVVFIYREKFKFNFEFYKKLFIGFLPAAVLGFLFKSHLSELLDNHIVVAWSLIIGGIIMIATDRIFNPQNNPNEYGLTTEGDQLSVLQALKIGFTQCFALIPGVSRSASTIVGGQVFGLSRKAAAEFSFFLAVPTLTAAALYKTWKIKHLLASENFSLLAFGIIMSFIFAFIAIKFFIRMVQKYGFTWFGVYRIILGAAVLLFMKS